MLTSFFFATLIIIWLCMTSVFLLASVLHDNSIVDVFYGLVYVVVAWDLIYLAEKLHPVQAILTFLITIWGVRLATRIGRKNWGKPEDFRYAAWRTAWMEKGKLYFILRSYLQIFMLQGLVIFLVILPVVIVAAKGAFSVHEPLLYAGLIVWAIGFFFEVVADWQLDQFIGDQNNRDRIMTRGLFRFTRRPNYFGESLCWWGIALTAASTLTLPTAFLAFISPITITYIVYAVTGPMLEAKWKDNPEYQAYAARTNYFVPGLPRE